MSRAARRWSWLTALAVAGAVVVTPAARADDEYAPGPRTVEVGPGKFKNETTRVLVNENVTFILKDDVEYKHSIAFSHPPNPTAPTRYELDPANPDARTFTVTFDQPGYHTYRCTLHPHRGVIKARNPVTTTTPGPSPTATTTPTVPTTTRRAETTSTTGPATATTAKAPAVTAAGSTSQPGLLVSAVPKATSTTTATAARAEDPPIELTGNDAGEAAFDDHAVHRAARDCSSALPSAVSEYERRRRPSFLSQSLLTHPAASSRWSAGYSQPSRTSG